MVYVFLAEGFEEVEALATVDVLRRCGIQVQTVGVGGTTVTGSHGISVCADLEDVHATKCDGLEAVVLPGGMPGTLHLEQSEIVQSFIDYAVRHEILLCAICAAPSILGHLGLLAGKKAPCFPGFEEQLTGAQVTGEPAVQDGKIITGKGAGCVFEFALLIGQALQGAQKADEIRKSMQCIG